MSSAFDRRFEAAGVGRLLSHFGRPITYTPAGGGDVSLTAIVGREMVEEIEREGDREKVRRRKVTITTDPDNTQFGGVADPAQLATVTIDSEVWSIEARPTTLAGFAKLSLVIHERMEQTRRGYRR